MKAPRAEAHRAQAKNAGNDAPFPPPLMIPRNIRMSPGANQRKEDDCISVHASDDDVAQLLAEPPVCATVTDKQNATGEDELLKELVASLQEEDRKGPQVQQQLADIAIKRWGNKLNPDKMTSILGKHPQPENCEDMSIARVNPEIWAPLNAAKRKADLRLANMQQALKKATFAIVTTCDKLLRFNPKSKQRKWLPIELTLLPLWDTSFPRFHR